ncbi:MAG: hypothetical protein GY706_04800, partial [Bacteroides sp.]|nr:hypothetical protein [Bacteroides sp.]
MTSVKSDTNRAEDLSSVKRALLQQRLRGKAPAAARDTEISKRPESATPTISSMQHRLWYLDLLEPNTAVYNIPSALKLSGKLDVGALKNSLNEIVRRHEILRTTYRLQDENVIQVVAPLSPIAFPVVDLQGYSNTDKNSELNIR